jgi:elongation factor G
VNAISGGAIPRQFIPAVEKGIRERMARGGNAGFPVVDVKVTLTDGKTHDNDSDNRSFELAGSKAFQAAFSQCEPVLLEPVLELEITCPHEATGSVIGDLNARRGRVLQMELRAGRQWIKARVPMAEVSRYGIELEALCGGRGVFITSFSHYQEVPKQLAERIRAERVRCESDD